MLKEFIKRHLIDDFPLPDKCFDCNKLSCKDCKVKGEKIDSNMPMQAMQNN